MYARILVSALLSAAGASEPTRPDVTLQFSANMRVGQGFGHDGDGCIAANAMVDDSPVISKVWFDAKEKRLAQTNVGYAKVDPTPNTTHIGLYKETPPTEIDLTAASAAPGKYACTTEPLPPSYCRNGSRTCPPRFGTWGSFLTPFSSVLGMYYDNTTRLSQGDSNETWQWETTKLERMPNGTYLNVTWNYTYILAREPIADGSRPLLRFQWTQSIPLEPALPIHRDCFVFDYTSNYVPGPSEPARWQIPKGVQCRNSTRGSNPKKMPSQARHQRPDGAYFDQIV